MIIERVGKPFGRHSVAGLQAVSGRQFVFWG